MKAIDALGELCELMSEEYDVKEMYKDALYTAREALERQVPRKPDMRKIKRFDGYNQGWCSSCGCCIDDSLYDNVKYCYQCGQAIDWSEEE